MRNSCSSMEWAVEDDDKPPQDEGFPPVIALLAKVAGVAAAVVAGLFLLGFVMGLMGYRPASFDWGVVENQWNRVADTTPQPVNELDRVPVSTDVDTIEQPQGRQ